MVGIVGRHRSGILAVGVASVLVLGGCGDDGAGETDQEASPGSPIVTAPPETEPLATTPSG